MKIDLMQDMIAEELAECNGDLERILLYILGQGRCLKAMPAELHTNDNLIKGCHSSVWLCADKIEERFYFRADSDTIISRGLVSILVRIFDGQCAGDILAANLSFLKHTQLERFIGTKRSNGFASMAEHMRGCVNTK